MSRHRIIVGVDYGTTYSGVSFVPTNKDSIEDIHVIRNWPGKDGEWKTPTRIAYAVENSRAGLSDDLWGFQVEPQMISCSWTKLLLDAGAKTAEHDDPKLKGAIDDGRLRLPSHRNAQGVATDFMRELYKLLEHTLIKEFGASVLDSTPIDCWVTVPAVWSDQAQKSTKTAALEAGFGSRSQDTISVIPEPEAAAIAVLKNMTQPEALNKPRKGDNILVCDCGGGTVDITSYTVAQVEPVPEFDELCVGIGGKCGSTSIDRSLHQLMSERFGSAWDDVELRRKGPGSNFMNKWEAVKRQFGDRGDERVQEIGPVRLRNVPNSQYYDEEEGMVRLTKADVQRVFDPTIQEVIALVQEQKNTIAKQGKQINRLVLVGGFGDSNYLYSELKKWCRENGNIQPYCPVDPQAAIVRGAALRGLVGMAPKKKRCRRHYGCAVANPFRDGIDSDEDAYYDPFSGTKMCRNRVLWLISKGAEITESTTRSHHVSISQRLKDPDRTATTALFSCSMDSAPDSMDADRMELVGMIRVDFSSINIGRVETRREFGFFGSRYYEVDCEIQVKFGSKSGLLEVNAFCGGMMAGRAEIEFD